MSKFCCSNKHQVSEFGDTNEWKVNSAMNKLLTEHGRTKDEEVHLVLVSMYEHCCCFPTYTHTREKRIYSRNTHDMVFNKYGCFHLISLTLAPHFCRGIKTISELIVLLPDITKSDESHKVIHHY